MDGILNNDGLKHNGNDEKNETWQKLLIDLKIYDGMTDDDHIQFLRTQFVVGASYWCAGKNGSLENDQANYGYTDDQWEFIWSSMAENGAWAVPDIHDNDGHFVKHNIAPELLIKYVAHHLQCHIVVFDLHLGIIQFCDGNRLKRNNV